MYYTVPDDIKAETLLNYLPENMRSASLVGQHKRNAYEDIASLAFDDEGKLRLEIGRRGIYDILPEALFHPIDRFENLPANDYKDRLKEEIELQQQEEDKARAFFKEFDSAILTLSCIAAQIKDSYAGKDILTDIIADSLSTEYKSNRFVRQTRQFLPSCRTIRGNKSLIALMLRYVLKEEGLIPVKVCETLSTKDQYPRYNSTLEPQTTDNERIYLGNEFEENVTIFEIEYWKEDECNESFPDFITEMKVYENFINEYFAGIETMIRFKISTISLNVRLSDNICHNYLGFNTNL